MEVKTLHSENRRIEKVIHSLQHDLEVSVVDCANVDHENRRLESELEKSRIEKGSENPGIPFRQQEIVKNDLENKTQLLIQATQVKTNLKAEIKAVSS